MPMKNNAHEFEPFIRDLVKNVYCRIRPSKVHGVGVFAIRTIPKGTNVFATNIIDPMDCDPVQIPQELIFHNEQIPSGVKQMVKDFMTFENGKVELPIAGFNTLNISFYLNHSHIPNVQTDDGLTFIALKDIAEGEELFSNYTTYTDEPEYCPQ
jgi:SET domain-containing protein